VDVEELVSELIPIRDALLKVFDGVPARARGEVQRLQVGLALTARGIAIQSEDTKPAMTLTLGIRQRSPSPRSGTSKVSARKQDIVTVDEPSPTSQSEDQPSATLS
jgi:hypothetical protein